MRFEKVPFRFNGISLEGIHYPFLIVIQIDTNTVFLTFSSCRNGAREYSWLPVLTVLFPCYWKEVAVFLGFLSSLINWTISLWLTCSLHLETDILCGSINIQFGVVQLHLETGNVWRCFGLSQLGWEYGWHLMGRS